MNFSIYLLTVLVGHTLFSMDAPLSSQSIKKVNTRAQSLSSGPQKRARMAPSASLVSHEDALREHSPSPFPAADLQKEKPVEVYTPTSTKVRSRLIKSMVEAIYGMDVADQKVRDLTGDKQLMCASPQSFARICNQRFREMVAQDFEKKGISPQDFKNHSVRASASVRDFARESTRLPAASRGVRALGKRLLSEIADPPSVSFRQDNELDDIAYAIGEYVELNEKEVKSDNMNELELAWLLAHEIQHIIHKDVFEAHTYKLAHLSKKGQKRERDKLRLILSRVHEVFADITPALRNKSLAQGYLACLTKWVKNDPDGGGDNHPKHGERADLAEGCIAFLDQSEREKGRAVRRNLQVEFDKLADADPQE